MRLRTIFAAGAVAAAGVLSAASPAFAAKTINYTNSQTLAGGTVVQTAHAAIVNETPGAVTVAFNCSTRTEGAVAAAIGLKACYLRGANGQRFDAVLGGDAGPGTAYSEPGVVVNAPAQRYRVCVQTAGLWQATGDLFETTLACSPYGT